MNFNPDHEMVTNSQSPSANPELDAPVSELGLSVRVSNCFKNAGIDYMHQLVAKSETELMTLRNFGITCLKEIKVVLGARGLGLKCEEVSQPSAPIAWDDISGDSRAERIYKYKAANPHKSWMDIVLLSGTAYVESDAKRWAKRNGMPWPINPKRARSLAKRQESWQKNSKGERAYHLRERGLKWGEIKELLGGVGRPAVIAEAYAISRNLPWPLLSLAQKWRREKDEADGAWLYQQALIESNVNDRVQRTIPELAHKIGRDRIAAWRILRAHANKHGLEIPRRKPRDEVFGMTCYSLRKQGLTWFEVAKKSGIGRGVHACEAARRYAWTNHLPWPILFEHSAAPRVVLAGTKKDRILDLLRAEEGAVSRSTILESLPDISHNTLDFALADFLAQGRITKLDKSHFLYLGDFEQLSPENARIREKVAPHSKIRTHSKCSQAYKVLVEKLGSPKTRTEINKELAGLLTKVQLGFFLSSYTRRGFMTKIEDSPQLYLVTPEQYARYVRHSR